MPTVDAAGVPVHYAEHGDAASPRTAVLLHGFTTDHRQAMGAFEPTFAGRDGWRRLYLDLPGMGRTPAGDRVTSTDDLFAVVRAAVDALAPGPLVVGGYSYGGNLARGLVAAEPDRFRGLALVCPMIVAPHDERDLPDHRVLVRESPTALGDPFQDFGVVHTTGTRERTEQEVYPGERLADGPALARIREQWAPGFPLVPAGSSYDAPVLFVMGRQDSQTGYRGAWQVVEHYPRATFAVLDRAGHNAPVEQPALLHALLDEWLDRVEEQHPHVAG